MAFNIYDDTLEQVIDEQVPSAAPDPRTAALDRVFQREDEATQRRVRAASQVAADVPPDRAAESVRLGRQLGLPPSFIARNFDAVKAHAPASELPPNVSAWLADPINTAVSRDDVDTLAAIERYLTNGARAAGAGVVGGVGYPLGVVQNAVDVLTTFPQRAGAFLRGSAMNRTIFEAGSEPTSPVALAIRRGAEAVGRAADALRGPQTGAGDTERAVYGGVESIGQMLPSIVLGLLGGEPLALGSIGAVTGGQSYTQARAQGTSIGRATTFAGLQGAIEVATEMIPAHRLFGDLAARSGFLKTLIHQIAPELVGEEVATALQDLNELTARPENRDKSIGELWRDESLWREYGAGRVPAAVATAISTAVAVGGTTAAAHATGRVLERIGEAAQQSKTLQRAPEQAAALVEQMTADAPNLYVPVDAWTTYWQSKGENPARKAAELTGDPDALAKAQASGEDLVIAKAAYVTQIAATDHNAFFVQEARSAPEQMNQREAETFTKTLDTALATPPAEDTSSAGKVRAQILEQLTTAGVEPTRARAYAGLYESVFGTLGQRAGIDPLELYSRYKLQVRQNALGNVVGDEALAQHEPGFEPPAGARYESDFARGAIHFGPEGQVTIDLFKNANASTFLHESGHLFLQVLQDLAPNSEQMTADLQALQTWFGVKDAAKLLDKNGQIKTRYHEQFARGFEAYLRDGTAPSPEVRGIFALFRSWLHGVYRSLLDLDVELTPEVRGVFDRIVATDEAIARAEAEGSVAPLFDSFTKAEAVGMTEAAFEKYQGLVADASEAARQELTRSIERQQARAQKAWWKAERKAIRAEVTAELQADPVYRARAAMRTELKGQPLDLVADAFGFESGDVLAAALKAAPPMPKAIAAEVRRRMTERHGDPLSHDRLHARAVEVVHGDRRADVVRAELAALTKGMQEKAIPPAKALKAYAERTIAGLRVRELRPGLYLMSAQRASAKAFDLQGSNRVAAIQAKQQELVSLALYREAIREKRILDGDAARWGRMFRSDADVARTRNMDYVAAARVLVAPLLYEGRKVDNAQDAMKTLRTLDPQMAELVDHYIDAVDSTTPLADRTIEDVRALRDVVGGLWAIARREGQIDIDGRLVSRDEAKAALTDQLATHGPGKFADIGVAGLPSQLERWHRLALGGKAWGRRVESWVTAMDGGPDGPFRRYLWNPVKERINVYRVEKVQRLTEYKALLDPIQDTLTAKKIAAPELGYTFGNDGSGGMTELLGALLHSGNRADPTSNLAKLLVGRGWGAFRADGTLDTSRFDAFIARMQREGVLTKAHYDFAQGVWNLFESLKPGLQKTHRSVYGFYFKEVQADAIETPWGPYRGGYVPALADPIMSTAAEIRNEKQMAFEEGASYSLPSAGKKSTIARVKVFEPLAMNLTFIPQHIDWALRFTHIQPAVKDVTRIVTDKGFRGVLDGYDPQAAGQMLMPWLMRSATQRITEKGKWAGFDRFMTGVRSRTALQALAYSVNNGLQQFTGLLVAATKVKPRYLANAAFRYFRAPREMSAYIRNADPFMETFLTSQAIELQKKVDNIILNPSTYAKGSEFVRAHSQILAGGAQNIVNHIAWLGARNQAEAEGVLGMDAIRRAASVVRETQGSFFPEDVSRFEANTPFVRVLAMFNSYFNMLGNNLTTETGIALRSDRGLWGRTARIASLWTIGYLLPNAISNAILLGLKGDWNDDDDDTHIDEILSLLLSPSIKTAFSMVPVFGQFGTAAYGALFTDSSYDDDIRVSPTAGMIGAGIKDLAGHSSTKQEVKDFLSILGLLTNLPLGALGRPVGFLFDVKAGKARPENPIDFARGLVTGQSPDQVRAGR